MTITGNTRKLVRGRLFATRWYRLTSILALLLSKIGINIYSDSVADPQNLCRPSVSPPGGDQGSYTILLVVFGLGVSLSSAALGQSIIEPEQCILDALKSAPPDSAAMIRWNCVRRYIKAVEPKAISLPLADFTHASLQWFPSMQAFPNPVPERIVITLKNNAPITIISADIVIMNIATKKSQTYTAYADYPIDPNTVGTLEADVISGFTGRDFNKHFEWGYVAVYGTTH
jgi:hypothetical protein